MPAKLRRHFLPRFPATATPRPSGNPSAHQVCIFPASSTGKKSSNWEVWWRRQPWLRGARERIGGKILWRKMIGPSLRFFSASSGQDALCAVQPEDPRVKWAEAFSKPVLVCSHWCYHLDLWRSFSLLTPRLPSISEIFSLQCSLIPPGSSKVVYEIYMKEMELTENKILHQTSAPKYMELGYLSRITQQFTTVIGSGGFGTVYKGTENDEFFAVKKLNVTLKFERDDTQWMNEVVHLMDLDHPNIVRLKGYCYAIEESEPMECDGTIVPVSKVHRLLCLEYLPCGSLRQHLKDESCGLDWHVRYKIIEGICNGLHYLHESAVLHLDLKPDNILLDEYMEPKIADFGLSRLFGLGRTHISTANISGTPGYIAPECIGLRHIRKESDIYSLGVIIIEIIAGVGKHPENRSRQEYTVIRENWKQRLRTASTSLEEDCENVNRCIDLALMCMDQEPRRRPNIERIIEILHTHENMNTHAFEIEEDSAIPREHTSEEQAALLHRPKTVLKSEQSEMEQCSKMGKKRQLRGMWNFSITAIKRRLTGVEMLKFGFMTLGAIAFVTLLVLLVGSYPFFRQVSFTVENPSLTRFAMVNTPETNVAYNISMILDVINHNWAMSLMYTKTLHAAYYFDGQQFDKVLLAMDGEKLPAKHTIFYDLTIGAGNDYISLGSAGVAEYKKQNATGVFIVEVRITGEMRYTARFISCEIKSICPLRLHLATPAMTAVVFQKVQCEIANPEKYC